MTNNHQKHTARLSVSVYEETMRRPEYVTFEALRHVASFSGGFLTYEKIKDVCIEYRANYKTIRDHLTKLHKIRFVTRHENIGYKFTSEFTLHLKNFPTKLKASRAFRSNAVIIPSDEMMSFFGKSSARFRSYMCRQSDLFGFAKLQKNTLAACDTITKKIQSGKNVYKRGFDYRDASPFRETVFQEEITRKANLYGGREINFNLPQFTNTEFKVWDHAEKPFSTMTRKQEIAYRKLLKANPSSAVSIKLPSGAVLTPKGEGDSTKQRIIQRKLCSIICGAPNIRLDENTELKAEHRYNQTTVWSPVGITKSNLFFDKKSASNVPYLLSQNPSDFIPYLPPNEGDEIIPGEPVLDSSGSSSYPNRFRKVVSFPERTGVGSTPEAIKPGVFGEIRSTVYESVVSLSVLAKKLGRSASTVRRYLKEQEKLNDNFAIKQTYVVYGAYDPTFIRTMNDMDQSHLPSRGRYKAVRMKKSKLHKLKKEGHIVHWVKPTSDFDYKGKVDVNVLVLTTRYFFIVNEDLAEIRRQQQTEANLKREKEGRKKVAGANVSCVQKVNQEASGVIEADCQELPVSQVSERKKEKAPIRKPIILPVSHKEQLSYGYEGQNFDNLLLNKVVTKGKFFSKPKKGSASANGDKVVKSAAKKSKKHKKSSFQKKRS